MFTKAGRIVSVKNTPGSKTRALLQKFRQNLSDLEKDEVRMKLKKEISRALVDGGIQQKMIDKLTLVFSHLLLEGAMTGHAETGE